MWNDLSMKDRARYIQMGISNGITDLSIIRDTYNRYAEGGIVHRYDGTTEETQQMNRSGYSLPKQHYQQTNNAYDNQNILSEAANYVDNIDWSLQTDPYERNRELARRARENHERQWAEKQAQLHAKAIAQHEQIKQERLEIDEQYREKERQERQNAQSKSDSVSALVGAVADTTGYTPVINAQQFMSNLNKQHEKQTASINNYKQDAEKFFNALELGSAITGGTDFLLKSVYKPIMRSPLKQPIKDIFRTTARMVGNKDLQYMNNTMGIGTNIYQLSITPDIMNMLDFSIGVPTDAVQVHDYHKLANPRLNKAAFITSGLSNLGTIVKNIVGSNTDD